MTRAALNRIMAGALLIALSGASSIAQAAVTRDALASLGEAAGGRPNRAAPAGRPAVEAVDYAAREAQAPELAQFQGGSGIYIGGGVVTILLIILLIVIIF